MVLEEVLVTVSPKQFSSYIHKQSGLLNPFTALKKLQIQHVSLTQPIIESLVICNSSVKFDSDYFSFNSSKNFLIC